MSAVGFTSEQKRHRKESCQENSSALERDGNACSQTKLLYTESS